MEHVDSLVIGAGVVGLAIARALALAGREVIIVEGADAIGTATSSRNSEVIHAGLYYPTGSLKAELCVAGREALYRYCASHNVPHRRCGKLVVASDPGEVQYLEKLAKQGAANGVSDLALIDGAALTALEPAIVGNAALHSPSTGIVDSHALMLAYLGDAEAAGAALALRTPVVGGTADAHGVQIRLGGDAPSEISARLVVNAAGLGAWDVTRAVDGAALAAVPPRFLCKGNYFGLAGPTPVRHLVYPVPTPGGLGTHLTLDLAGRGRFGPDVEWVTAIDYAVDGTRGEQFYAAVRRYWPGLADGTLTPDYSGIRPKVTGPGAPNGDFVIQGPEQTGAPGYVALYGIESPGITASLAIGDKVAALAARL